jgi:hypothetical protein
MSPLIFSRIMQFFQEWYYPLMHAGLTYKMTTLKITHLEAPQLSEIFKVQSHIKAKIKPCSQSS